MRSCWRFRSRFKMSKQYQKQKEKWKEQGIKEEKERIIKVIEDWFNDDDTCSGKPNCCIDECDLCVNCLDKLKDLINLNQVK